MYLFVLPLLAAVSDSVILYWIWPAIPALLILLSDWLVQRILNRYTVAPWWKANYVRVAGILVFMLAFTLSADHRTLLNQYFREQLAVSALDVVFVLSGLTILGLLQSGKLGKINVKGLEQYGKADLTVLPLLGYSLVWITYLILYELYFRGFLLFLAFPGEALPWIILYNVVLYALIHASKNLQQVLMSVPFGLLLCLVTVYTGHIWFSIIIHIGLALGFELPLLMASSQNKLLTK